MVLQKSHDLGFLLCWVNQYSTEEIATIDSSIVKLPIAFFLMVSVSDGVPKAFHSLSALARV